MSKYIYFVGKPYPYLDVIDSLKQQGYKIGLFLDNNIRLINSKAYDKVVSLDFTSLESLLAGVAEEDLNVSGLICSFENYIVAKAKLAEYFKVPAPSVESAKLCTNKYLMRQAFRNENESITPKFGEISSLDDAMVLAKTLGYPLMLKPTNLMKSLLVMRCNNEGELIKNFNYASSRIGEIYQKYKVYDQSSSFILEEYVEGKICSIAAFIDASGVPHFCEGAVALTNAQDIGINDNYLYSRSLPAVLSKDLMARLIDVSRQGISALKMSSTPAHVELIHKDKTVKLIEIGARIGGYRPQMYKKSYGLDLVAEEIRLALGEKPLLSGSLRALTAVYEIFPESEGTFSHIIGDEIAPTFTRYTLKAKKGDKVGPAKNGYKAAAIITISNPNQQVFQDLCGSVGKLKVALDS